jgi:hypothetical protein
MKRARWAILGAALVMACAKQQPPAEQKELDPALQAHVLESVPRDVPNRMFLDFEGKVHLIGYALEPADQASPGTQMKLTLYWQSVARLGEGWSLFTHVLAPNGTQLANVDNVGVLRQVQAVGGEQRQALPPSDWQPGKVYVDEQAFEMPRAVTVPEVTIAVGIWREKARLDVLSGPSDGQNRGIVAHVRTGVTSPAPKAPRS